MSVLPYFGPKHTWPTTFSALMRADSTASTGGPVHALGSSLHVRSPRPVSTNDVRLTVVLSVSLFHHHGRNYLSRKTK